MVVKSLKVFGGLAAGAALATNVASGWPLDYNFRFAFKPGLNDNGSPRFLAGIMPGKPTIYGLCVVSLSDGRRLTVMAADDWQVAWGRTLSQPLPVSDDFVMVDVEAKLSGKTGRYWKVFVNGQPMERYNIPDSDKEYVNANPMKIVLGAGLADNQVTHLMEVSVHKGGLSDEKHRELGRRALNAEEMKDPNLLWYAPLVATTGSNTIKPTAGTMKNYDLGFWDGINPPRVEISPVVASWAATAVGPPARIAIVRQPAARMAQRALSSQPLVEVQDASGNTVVRYNGSVTVSLADADGTLSGTRTVPVREGQAHFADLSIGSAGEQALVFQAGDLTARSVAFTVPPLVLHRPAVTVEPLLRSAALRFNVDPTTGKTPQRATLEWRATGETRWKKAQDFVRVESDYLNSPRVKPDPRMATMLFGLLEGGRYEYRVTALDGDYDPTPVAGAFRTKTTRVPTGARVYRVTPKDNLEQRLAEIMKDGGAGKIVEFDGGVYRGGLPPFPWTGKKDAWLVVRGKAGQTVTFDGSDPAWDGPARGRFTQVVGTVKGQTFSAEDQVWVAKDTFTYLPRTLFYEMREGGEPWRVPELTKGAKLWGPSEGINHFKWRVGLKEPAYCVEDGKLYIRLHNGRDPNSVFIRPVRSGGIGFLGNPNNPDVGFVKFENLNFRYHNIGWVVYGVHDIIWENVHCKGTASFVTDGQSDMANAKEDLIIKGCSLKEKGLYPTEDWPTGMSWNHLKATWHEDWCLAVSLRGERVSIVDSEFEGQFNGVSFAGWSNDYWQVDNCSFTGITDDAMELETVVSCIAWTRNRIRRSYKGFSAAPVQGGPVYVIRCQWLGQGEYANVPNFDRQAFTKLGNNPGNYGYSTGKKFFLHNTAVNMMPPGDTSNSLAGFSHSGPDYEMTVLNNYLASDVKYIDFALNSNFSLGYDHIFNGNVYVLSRPTESPRGYTGNAQGLMVMAMPSVEQGDWAGSWRGCRTFDSWQRGRNDRAATDHWPGYDANPSDLAAYIHSLHEGTYRTASGEERVRRWMHDPDGHAYPADAAQGGRSPAEHLMDPKTFDFRPKPGWSDRGIRDMERWGHPQVNVANIAYDCGPGWARYQEDGPPTPGATPAGRAREDGREDDQTAPDAATPDPPAQPAPPTLPGRTGTARVAPNAAPARVAPNAAPARVEPAAAPTGPPPAPGEVTVARKTETSVTLDVGDSRDDVDGISLRVFVGAAGKTRLGADRPAKPGENLLRGLQPGQTYVIDVVYKANDTESSNRVLVRTAGTPPKVAAPKRPAKPPARR